MAHVSEKKKSSKTFESKHKPKKLTRHINIHRSHPLSCSVVPFPSFKRHAAHRCLEPQLGLGVVTGSMQLSFPPVLHSPGEAQRRARAPIIHKVNAENQEPGQYWEQIKRPFHTIDLPHTLTKKKRNGMTSLQP